MNFNKLLLSTLIILSFTFTVFGQTEKGKFFVSGDINLDFSFHEKKFKNSVDITDEGHITNFGFSPFAGYFLSNKLAVGISVPVSIESEKTDAGNIYRLSSFVIAPFIRYYLGQGKLKPFIYGLAGTGKLKAKIIISSDDIIESSYNLFVYEFGYGLAFYLNDIVSLDVTMNYTSEITQDNSTFGSKLKEISRGANVNIGFTILF